MRISDWKRALFLLFYIVSSLFIESIILVSEYRSHIILKDVCEGYFRRCMLDFTSSIEICMIAWETITVFEEYRSLKLFGILLYFNLLSKAYRYNIWAGVACPYTLIQSYVFYFRHKVRPIKHKNAHLFLLFFYFMLSKYGRKRGKP